MEIEVEWETKPKSGITNVDLLDLGCKTKKEWNALDKGEQKRRLENTLIEYERPIIRFIAEW